MIIKFELLCCEFDDLTFVFFISFEKKSISIEQFMLIDYTTKLKNQFILRFCFEKFRINFCEMSEKYNYCIDCDFILIFVDEFNIFFFIMFEWHSTSIEQFILINHDQKIINERILRLCCEKLLICFYESNKKFCRHIDRDFNITFVVFFA